MALGGTPKSVVAAAGSWLPALLTIIGGDRQILVITANYILTKQTKAGTMQVS